MVTKIDEFEIPFVEAPHQLVNIWVPFGRDTKLLPKGWVKREGKRPLPIDIVWDKDVPIPLRDGVTLYGDVFRPANSEDRLPAILPWSPYGKTGTGKQTLDRFKWRVGVPDVATSGLENWEGPDPAEWCARGYAVVQVDARGCLQSEGNRYVYGSQEARDGYDTVEWIASQPWCTGSVGLAGNSWLATMQWFIAAEKPPHLKAIAPWEGLGDYYRESICRGGIPDHTFWDALFSNSGGKSKREDVSTMVDTYPFWNSYWEDKKPKLGRIDVPMYALASYSTALHTEGSIRGYLLSSSKEKWLRLHATQEWYDLYQKENLDDLQMFFDRYLKGVNNGWEKTPRIRLSLVGYNRPSIVNRPIGSYPPPEFTLQTLYLDAENRALCTSPVPIHSEVSYKAADKQDPGCGFTYRFDRYTELCGFSRVQLFMCTHEHNDMDVYVVLRKMDKEGNLLEHFNVPFEALTPGTTADDVPPVNVFRYVGPNGRLRASHREVMEEPGLTAAQRSLLSEAYVWHPHTRETERKLNPGEIVALDIGLWPGGIVFDAGEMMHLVVKGSLPIRPEHPGLDEKMANFNVGHHILHTGEAYPSKLQVYLSQGQEEHGTSSKGTTQA